jgi:CRP-like cAMP-binding protein
LSRNNIAKKTEFLQGFKLFSELTVHTLQKLTFYMEEKKYSFKQLVYGEGDKSDGVYLIKDGEFEVTKKSKYSQESIFNLSRNANKINKRNKDSNRIPSLIFYHQK